jgi:hypothetical protein
MAFPTIPTTGAGRVLALNQLNTTATRTFPALSGLTKNAGDLLIAIVVAYQSSTTNAQFSGWTEGFTEIHDSGSSTTLAMGVAYKFSTGSETAAPTVTQAATITGDASMILLSIPGAHASQVPEVGARVSGTTAAANPAALNPAGWNIEDTLWISVVGSGMTSTTGSWTATGTVGPTNYTGWVDTNAADLAVGDCEAAVSFRQNPVASEDVGTAGVDLSNARNGAVVIAVRPAATASAVLVTDNFDRADSGTIGNDSNANAWIENSGVWEIFSNSVRQTDTATNPGELLCGTDMADNTLWAEGTLSASAGTGSIGVMVRMDATAFTGVSFEVADGAYKLIEVSGGSPNTVFTGSAHTHAAGEVYAAEINTAGTINLYLNGSVVATTTSSFNLGDTRVALHFNDDSTGSASGDRWNNFRAGVGPYPGPAAGATDVNAEAAEATGAAFDAAAEVIWSARLLMPPMVAP